MLKVRNTFKKLRNGSIATLFLAIQASAALVPFLSTQKVFAADTATLYPNGQGTYTSWGGDEDGIDETSNFSCNTLDSIITGSSNARESVDIDLNSIPDGSTVTSVDVTAYYRESFGSNGTFQTFTRLNGTNQDSGVNIVASSGTCAPTTQTINVADTVKSAGTTLEIGVLKTATDSSWVAVGAIHAVVTYDEPTPVANLTVTKTVVNDDNGTSNPDDFNIRLNGGAPLSGGTVDGDEVEYSVELTPGVEYTITEDDYSSEYDLTTFECMDVTGAPLGTTFTPQDGQQISCNLVNDDVEPEPTGTITVRKITDPANDTTEFTANITGDAEIVSAASQTLATDESAVFEVEYGTFSITETPLAGWTETNNTCTDIVVSDNTPTPSCEITNTKNATVTIIKDSQPEDEENFGFVSNPGANFVLDDDGDETNDPNNGHHPSQTTYSVPAGNFSVTETVNQNGWKVTDIQCNDDDFTYQNGQSNVSLTLEAGQELTCTFVNEPPARISGTKFITDADGGNPVPAADWVIQLIQGNNSQFAITDQNGNYTFENLLPGPYTLIELLTQQQAEQYTQICSPDGGTIEQGQLGVISGNDFCNFRNGSISGYKYDDRNGDGQRQWWLGEDKLPGWTITLTDTDSQTTWQDVTDGNGEYSFENIRPGTYNLCEIQQQGWLPITPQNGCYEVVIDISGESNNLNFGNQGRGTITVIKNVDHDGDGQVDEQDSTDWEWDINFGSDHNTGSNNPQNVAAGTYLVREHQEDDYHLDDVECTGEQIFLDSTIVSVTVSPGENVVCTFTNQRDSGEISVTKVILPLNDDGQFDLNINGQTELENAGNFDSTGDVTVPTGEVSVSETAGDETSLDDYVSYHACFWDTGLIPILIDIGEGAETEVDVWYDGQEIDCYFLNKRKADITVTKFHDYDHDGEKDEDEPGLPGWEINLDEQTQVTGEDGATVFENLDPFALYELSENQQEGWTLSGITCQLVEDEEEEQPPIVVDLLNLDQENQRKIDIDEENNESEKIFVKPGQHKECYIGNYTESELELTKSNNATSTTQTGETVTYTLEVKVPENSGAVFDAKVVDLPPEGFDVIEGSETSSQGELSSPYASPGQWNLGTLFPGNIVTVTYQAVVGSNVTPGSYPDLAFASGFNFPGGTQLLANTTSGVFAGSNVVVSGQVLGASTLADTGNRLVMMQFIIPALVIFAVAALDKRQKKGGRA